MGVRQYWRPCLRRVADFARLRGNEVTCALRLGRRMLAIVAQGASRRRLRVIKWRRSPGQRGVAAVAGIRCCHVSGSLAGCRQPCWRMARNAGTRHLRMVNRTHSWCPLGRIVANFAGVGCRKVSATLARNLGVVVARETCSRHLRVVHRTLGWHELHSVMASFANIAGGHMRRALAESRKLRWAVTCVASGSGLRVVKWPLRRNPSCGHMAVFANIAGREMCEVLAGGARAIVAREAGSGHTHMAKHSWLPGVDVMAVFANIAGRQVVRRINLALGWLMRTIMAAQASARGLRMVEQLASWFPGKGRMAGGAII